MASSYEGMEGMEGMVGNAGNAGGGPGGGSSDWFFADRVDRPFVKAETHHVPVWDQQIDIPSFREQNWSSTWYPWLVLTQFVKNSGWDTIAILPDFVQPVSFGSTVPADLWNSTTFTSTATGLTTKATVDAELDHLKTMAFTDRPNALGEILGQKDEFISYFLDLLTATSGHPATTKVLSIAGFIGAFCSMYYKGLYQRPRAPMLRPALLPPIAVPGHASFPSGHSTQAHLMALCLEEVLTGTALLPTPSSPPHTSPIMISMTALAERIARNREIAGLHYHSDSVAGLLLAQGILPLLQATPASVTAPTWYQKAVIAARAEWNAS
jgi:membrane-associated phospholipid phosphatase